MNGSPKPSFGIAPTAKALLVAFAVLGSSMAFGQVPATVNINAGQPGVNVSSNLFGIFFEEINYGGEGGIYAEMVRNRSFYDATNPVFWTLVTNGTATGTMTVDPTQRLNTNNANSLKLTMTSGSGGIGAGNAGFWGMNLQSNATYNLSFFAKATNGFAGPVVAQLQNASGSMVYAQASFGGLTTNWQNYSASLVASGTDTNARLVLSLTNAGTVWLDFVSLFPQATFLNRPNGLRADIAGMLTNLNPSFGRYPGGNFIEGLSIDTAVRWKKTIGDITQRPGHMNDGWGYWSTDGYGLDEFAQQCQDMNMQLVYGIYAGLSLQYDHGVPNTIVPLDQMGPYVQDAVDLIEYCNGDTNTTWGALRAANGHPAPYNLKYLEIGNENADYWYDERYALFYDAIKSKYPDIQLISAGNWSAPPTSRPRDVSDEHFYDPASTFLGYATRYDGYNRSGPKVFVGEYAVKYGYGTYGNLSAALGEAAFMTGIERNSDIVIMACYAPLFSHVNGSQWRPDLIYYDSSRVFGTPSYYVQQLFGQNPGHVVLPASVSVGTGTNNSMHGAIGVGSWNTSVQYTNITVTSNGVTLYQSDFVNNGTSGWTVRNGNWGVADGVYQQTSTTTTDCRATTGDTSWANYTITLRARRTGGSEGFLILFNWLDDNNWAWWNVGGWNNTLDGLEQMVAGNKTTLATVPQTPLADNTWYDIRIVINGARVQCYLNDVLKQDHTFTTTASLFTSAIYNQADQQIVTKLVNPYGVSLATTFNVAGVPTVASNATLIQLTSASPSDENTLDYPTNVFPVTSVVTNAGTNFTLTLPAYSLSVLRLQLPSPLPPNGLTAVAAGAQVGLSWPPYAGATNYVLKRATNSGGPYTVLATTTGTTYSDTNVVLGGVQYYYVLAAELSSGPTPDSTEASAITPPPPSSYVWGGANSIWTDTSLPGWNGGPPISGDSVTITNGVVALTTGNQPGGVAVTVGGSGVLRSAGYYLTPGSLTFTNGGTVSLENTSQYHSYGGGWLPTTVTVTGASAAGSFLTGDASIAFWNQSPVTTFNVADVTGNANADLTVSAGLKDGVYSGNDNLWTPAAVVKTGAGTLKLTAINTYIGGTTVNEGTLELSGAAGGNGLIRGAVTVNSGATLALTGGDGTGFGWNNAISSLTVNGGTVNTPGGMHIGFGSTVVTLTNGAVITGGTNQWNGDGLLTFSSTGDSQNTISSALVLRSDAGTNHTFNVADGAAATDLLISGNLSDLYPEIGWLSPAALVKTGDGTLALNGANTYDGVTTVSAGTLGGTGSIQGPVIVQSGAALSPGTSLGTLTISNTLTLQAGSQTFVELNAATGTNDLLRGVTTVNYDGTLVVSNVAGNVSAGQTFQLFSAANRTGNFSAVTGVPGVTWSFNPTNGMLTAITAVSLNPTNLTASVSGTNLTLNWPGDHTGWTLIQQTNRLDSGVSVNMNDWMRVPNSSATNQVVIPILPDASGGYYRLVYP